MVGIFTRRLLPTSPSGVSEGVDVLCASSLVKMIPTLRNQVLTGVQKSRPVRLALLKALASVEMTLATSVIRPSSKAAPMRIGCGKEVE